MGANKPATTTTKQTRSPWDVTQPQLQDIASRANTYGNNSDLFTPAVSDTTRTGIGQLEALGQQGPSQGNQYLNSVLGGSGQGFDTGLGQLQSVANGSYINANPYLAAALEPAMNDVQNRVNGQFTAAGRYGSGAHASELARQLGYTAANAYQQNYNTERSNQDNAARSLYGGGFQGAGFTGQLDQSAAVPAMYSLQAGQMKDAIENQIKQAPISALNWQNSIISPMSAQYADGQTTSQTVQPRNPFTQALGIGQMGLGLLSAPMTGGASLMGTAANPSLLGKFSGYYG